MFRIYKYKQGQHIHVGSSELFKHNTNPHKRPKYKNWYKIYKKQTDENL